MTEAPKFVSQNRGRSENAKLAYLIKRANLLADAGRYDEAIAKIKEAMTIFPEHPKCNMQLANIYTAQRQLGLAVDAMYKAIELDPHDSTVQDQLLRTLLDLERLDDAVKTCKAILKRSPKSLLPRDVLSIVYFQQGKMDKSLRVIDELIRLDPMDADHYFKRGIILQQMGETGMAVDSFSRALDMDSDSEWSADARNALIEMDGLQIKQIMSMAVEDSVFRAKLQMDPVATAKERGFHLSGQGNIMLRQLDIFHLPSDFQNPYYH